MFCVYIILFVFAAFYCVSVSVSLVPQIPQQLVRKHCMQNLEMEKTITQQDAAAIARVQAKVKQASYGWTGAVSYVT